MKSLNELAVSKKDYKLSDGRILPIGINFRSLLLMTSYEGGFKKLEEDMSEQNDDINTKLKGCAHILYSLIKAAGEEDVTVDDAAAMIGLSDFDKLFEIFEEYTKAIEVLQKKTDVKQKKLKK